ncbi:cullin-associated NEDD8-dissociated protein 1-like isoform X2 [Diabrotica undecimpunctata]|uniref:cullin-associated NEDD8-dissociated protein 1-like isoform X2 n=1 Tax=Diabrotica undecimpunctata TaxID=50387 RepID=UPI003B63D679
MEELSVFDYLERLSSEDSDVRMSAVQNLSEGVAKGLLIFDDEYQIQVIYRVLALLEDQKIQIKNEAVKCLAAFVKKFPPREVESVLTILSTNVISNFRRLRDISIHTLKLIFSELPQAFSLPEHICEIISDVLDTAVYNVQLKFLFPDGLFLNG